MTQDELAGIRRKWQAMFCQHCKAMQKTNDTVVECWYNPLNHGDDTAFCASNCDAIDSFFSLTVSSGGGVCDFCHGAKGTRQVNIPFPPKITLCPTCDGTGRTKVVEKTLEQLIEEATKDGNRR